MRALVLLALLAVPLTASAGDVPRRMTWHGRLTKADGSPETNPQTLKFALYGAASGGSSLWEESLQNVPVVNGAYAVVLGLTSPLPLTVVNGQDLYLGLTLNGGAELSPRVRVASVPYALKASDAATLEGKAASDYAAASHSHADATPSADGFMSSADKAKLDGLNAAAYALVAHTHAAATQSADGFLSAADKTKLDGLNAAAYALVGHSHSNVNNTTAGFMAPTDKVKLDKYASNPPSWLQQGGTGLPTLSCTYRFADVTGDNSVPALFTATARCSSSEVLTGSACGSVDSSNIPLSGNLPVGVTPAVTSSGKGASCTVQLNNATDKVQAWAYCCSLQ